MKRDPALQTLSRDHHQALRLARMLQPETPAGLRTELPSDADAAVAWLAARVDAELLPHFLLEERELVPLGLCGSQALRDATERLLDEHRRLRAGFSCLTPADFDARRAALGRLLAEHVRFEEREWFPALERTLSTDQRTALGRRLKPVPDSLMVGFHRDEQGAWVAELDCGHARHIPHRPPFSEAPWVEQEAGRVSMLGTPVPCVLCQMPRRPTCLVAYRQTPQYAAEDVPAGLLRSHRLKRGTWGEIEVLAGRVQYVLEDQGDTTVTLRPGVIGVVAPERPHHIRPSPDARLRVQFLRCGPV